MIGSNSDKSVYSQARIFSTNLAGSGGMACNEASGSFVVVMGGCIRGLGMGRVRLSVGGKGCDGKLRQGPSSELWAAPGLRWRRLVVECHLEEIVLLGGCCGHCGGIYIRRCKYSLSALKILHLSTIKFLSSLFCLYTVDSG